MKKIKYILLSLIVVLATSCEDFLDRPPLDAISVNEYWNTASDLEKYVRQYYAKLPRHGTGMHMLESNSDNLILLTPNQVMNGVTPLSVGNWINEWADIRSLNIFFDNYKKVTGGFETYAQFLGEAHFFKAWFYYELLKKYGDLPWYSSALEPNSDALIKPRDKRTLVADSILMHLDKATQYLGLRATTGNARLNKESALAFKTRVALFEGTWQKYHAGTEFATPGANPNKYFQACVDASEELMNGNYTRGIYNTGKPDQDYYTLFGLDNMSSINEVLLYRIASSAESQGSGVQFYTTLSTAGAALTWSLISTYLGSDGSPIDYLDLAGTHQGNDFLTEIAAQADKRLHATVWIPGDLRVASTGETFAKPWIDRGGNELCATGFQVKKFSNPSSRAAGITDGGNNNSETGYILFRYGEVLLNYAEALYELDGTVAYDVLNLLRQRAGMPDFQVIPQGDDPNVVDYGYSISDELYEIRRERRLELALEGYRADDYRRWAAHKMFAGKRPLGYPFKASEFPGLTPPPLDGNGLIDYFKTQMPNGYGFRPGQDYLSPIPQDELTLNPNLAQNPGW